MIMRHGIFLVLSALVVQVLSSAGDRSKIFRDCLARCEEVQCDPKVSAGLPIALRLAAWTCSDDCKYRCMHATTTREVEMGLRVKQYYGKWPFWRLGGIQEPASVAFSLLNLWTHLRGGAKIRREISRDHPLKFYYLTWSFVSVNTWIWSSVFHTRGKAYKPNLCSEFTKFHQIWQSQRNWTTFPLPSRFCLACIFLSSAYFIYIQLPQNHSSRSRRPTLLAGVADPESFGHRYAS